MPGIIRSSDFFVTDYTPSDINPSREALFLHDSSGVADQQWAPSVGANRAFTQ
jgi:hypothetical protein